MTQEDGGAILESVCDERRLLVQFGGWLHRRLELDRKYIKDLKELREMVNPDWTGCTVRHLLLPTVQLLDEEVKAREAAYNRTVGHLDPLPTLERDIDVQSYAEVESAYEDVKAEREKARRPSVVTTWQEWVVGKELLLPDQGE
ncbi:hypothetical protein CPB86DRAFT_302761 [Serendipita vermifera]|nr:hypothetical protein CPB86DRAFT_302761 [Serendipita vermifera]